MLALVLLSWWKEFFIYIKRKRKTLLFIKAMVPGFSNNLDLACSRAVIIVYYYKRVDVRQNRILFKKRTGFREVLNVAGMHTPKQSMTAEEKSYWYIWMTAFLCLKTWSGPNNLTVDWNFCYLLSSQSVNKRVCEWTVFSFSIYP